MTKDEIALQITLAALSNKYINGNNSVDENYVLMNEATAENVAAFYNKIHSLIIYNK